MNSARVTTNRREERPTIMERSVITIGRGQGGRASEPKAKIAVDVSGGRPLAAELNIRAGAGGGVDRASLSVVEALMRALSADEGAAAGETGTRETTSKSVDTTPTKAAKAAKAAAPSSRRRSSR
jgi:hypothetical protein